jgi:DNA-directed RNA polymerase specialized sigma24 family protein
MDSLLKPAAHLMTLDQLRSHGLRPADPHRPDALLRLFDRHSAIPDPTAKPPPTYRLKDLRKIHPNCYRKWTRAEDDRLAQRAAEGATIAQLAAEFGRNKGAIQSRLARHAEAEPPPEDTQPTADATAERM